MKFIILFVVLFYTFGFNVNAQTYEFEINKDENLYNEIYSEFVSDELENSIPLDVNNFINSLEIDLSNPFSLKNLFTKEGFNNFKSYLVNKIKLPVKSISILITTIIICAFCSSFSSNNLQTKKALNYISVSSVILVFIFQLTSLINDSVNILNTLNILMLSFIPIYAGILIAALKNGVSSAFSTTTFFLCEIISFLSNKIIIPFTNCFVALSVSTGLSPDSKISGITRIIKKFSYIFLSFSMALFLAFLSIESSVSNVVDNVATKTAKFFISSFIPIIGPSLSETLGSFRSCISLLKSSLGIYVVIIIFLIILPKIIEISLYKLIFTLCSDVAEVYEIYQIKAVLEAFNQTLSLILAVIICVSLMFVFSITIINLAGNSI